MVDNAIDMLQKSIHCMSCWLCVCVLIGVATARPRSDELLPVFLFLAALYMHKSRDAPKASSGGSKTATCRLTAGDANGSTKESLQQKAVAVINEAVRINPNSNLTLLITGTLMQKPVNSKQSNGSRLHPTTGR
jgi:hypothetical protein